MAHFLVLLRRGGDGHSHRRRVLRCWRCRVL